MTRKFLFYIAIIAALLLTACAEKNTAYEDSNALDLISIVPVVGNPSDLDYDATHMYVALDQGGLAAIDMQSYQTKWYTTAPSEDGSITEFKQTRILSVVPEYNRLFLNEITGTDNIHIMDSSNPDSLKIIDSVTGGTFDIQDIQTRVLDTPIDDNPIEVIYCDSDNINYRLYNAELWVGFGFTIPNLPLRLSGVDFDDSYIYVAAHQRGLIIYSKEDGSMISEYPIYGDALKVKVANGYAFVASRQGGIQIVDVRNPNSPELADGFVTVGYAQSVDYHNGRLAVASGSGGTYVFDVANPYDLRLIQRITECGYANAVKFKDDILSIGSRDDGIFFYQMR